MLKITVIFLSPHIPHYTLYIINDDVEMANPKISFFARSAIIKFEAIPHLQFVAATQKEKQKGQECIESVIHFK